MMLEATWLLLLVVLLAALAVGLFAAALASPGSRERSQRTLQEEETQPFGRPATPPPISPLQMRMASAGLKGRGDAAWFFVLQVALALLPVGAQLRRVVDLVLALLCPRLGEEGILRSRWHGTSSARVLRYLIYLMTTDPDAPDAARIAVALAHLVDDAHGEELREVFIKKLGLPILLRALMPGTPAKQPRPEAYEQRLAEACHALHVLLQKVALKVPPEEAPLPPTPEAYLEQHFNNPEVSDITFLTHGEEFHAHKMAFARCPPEFHDDVAARRAARRGDADVVDFSHLPAETFRALMRFTYVSELDAERTDVVSDLMRVAVMYNMHELKRRCEVALAEHVRSRGAELDAAEVVERFKLAESLDAASVSRACALHALEHHTAMIAALGGMDLGDVLIIQEEVDIKVHLAARNLHKVEVIDVEAVNPVALLRHEKVLISSAAIKKLEARLS